MSRGWFVGRYQMAKFELREPHGYSAFQRAFAAHRASLAGYNEDVPQTALVRPHQKSKQHGMGFALHQPVKVYAGLERQAALGDFALDRSASSAISCMARSNASISPSRPGIGRVLRATLPQRMRSSALSLPPPAIRDTSRQQGGE
jgi:hypothetical protein